MSADDSHDLLPCPFCGGSAEFVPYKRDGLTLKCTSLGCIQRNQRSLRYGIDSLRTSMTRHWNSRAFTSRQPAENVIDVEDVLHKAVDLARGGTSAIAVVGWITSELLDGRDAGTGVGP